MQLPQYPAHDAYKDSGLPWIGSLPEHWKLERGKWLFQRAERPVRPDDEIVTCFRDGTVTLRSNRRTEGFTNALKEHGYQGIRTGDLVIHAMDAFAGAIGVSDSDGKSTPVYSACVPRVAGTVDPFFYAYYLRNLALSGVILSLAKGIRERSTDFRYNDFGELEIVFPPLEEQQAIARFLDDKTDKIDRAVKIKEGQIALLRERKQIIIQEAVTKGLNPDAPMKDSGIDWIGQIPAHWEKRKIRRLFDIGRGRVIPKEELVEGGLYPVFSSQTKNDGVFGYLNTFDFDRDQLTWTTDGANAGTVFRRRGKHNCTNVCGTLTPKSTEADLDYCVYAVGHAAMFYKRPDTNGAKIMNEEMAAIEFPLPPISEQVALAETIDAQNAKVNSAIELKEREIKSLKEYKATLINAAVTGKIKVI